MGKTKQKRFKVRQSPPTGLPSVKDFETGLESNAVATHSSLQPIIEQLSSINEETRECACASIANLVSTPANVGIIIQTDCIKIIAPLFLDKSPQVSVKALGAVRNISVDGGIEGCAVLVKKDVLTPLVALFHQFGVNWNPEQITVKKLRDLKIEIFIEATHLLLNLCEASEEAVQVFNKECLVDLLLPCLQYNLYGYDLAITVGQCLQIVTENNAQLSSVCRSPEKASVFENVLADTSLSTQHALLRALVVGILVNISEDIFASSNLLPVVVQTLSDVLRIDAVEILKADMLGINKGSKNGDDKMQEGNAKDEKLEDSKNCDYKMQEGDGDRRKHEIKTDKTGTLSVTHLLKAQHIALEVVTNICCSDDEWEELSSSESSSDEMAVDVQMEVSCSMQSDGISTEVQAAISTNQIFNKVLQKIEPVDIVPLLQNCEEQKNVIKSFERLQFYALLCCSNLVSSLDVSLLGGLDNLHSVWEGLVKFSSAQNVLTDLNMLEAVTSCMRAVVQKLADLESPKLIEVTSQDLQYLYEIEQRFQQSDIKVNIVRIVSTIGCMFAKIPHPHPFLKDVGLFLLEISCKENDLWVIAESLDAMFDVFSEDHIDPIVREIQMVERLKMLLPELKKQVSIKRKSLGEHYPVISTARINLIRFIKYKTQSS